MPPLFVLFQYLLPKRLLTNLVGILARSALIKPLFVGWFMGHYRIDLSEAQEQDPKAFANFNAFFTRALKHDARPIEGEKSDPVFPADGSISQIGSIEGDSLLQAKGRSYRLTELLACEPSQSDAFLDGIFSTVYLSPRDYHRVHMPLAGRLLETCYVPGTLFSVNETTTAGVDRLFARNERLVCWFETDTGPMVVVMVGALIVAGIDVVWESSNIFAGATSLTRRTFSAGEVSLDKGEELGRFFLGSTAITLLPRSKYEFESHLSAGSKVRMGQQMATAADSRPA